MDLPTLRQGETRPQSFGGQMRLFLRLRKPLRAAAVHVRRGCVGGAPVNLRSKAGAPPADVRLAAVDGEREAAEVGEGRVVTAADHGERRRGAGASVTRLLPQRQIALPEERRGQSLRAASAAWLEFLRKGLVLLGPG